MFQPFVTSAICHFDDNGFTDKDCQVQVKTQHHLSLPINVLHTLLGRVVQNGKLRRDGGRYFLVDHSLAETELQTRRSSVEARQIQLAEEFRSFAARTGREIVTNEDALSLILEFIERHHVSIVLKEDDGAHPTVGHAEMENIDKRPDEILTAKFISKVLTDDGQFTQILQEIIEGFVLQNALLLKDISTAGRRFSHLRVFLDSGLAFAALGYHGPAMELAVRELITLLRDTGATVEIFQETVKEMLRILNFYEEKLRTADGRGSLHQQRPLTRHFLNGNYSPSDVRELVTYLPRNLSALGISQRTMPKHVVSLTLDEVALGRSLSDPGEEHSPRVKHDVDCVAGILTIRNGHQSDSLDLAKAVLITTSGRTVQSVSNWFEAEPSCGGVSPMIHYLYLSNIAWLKKPASASNIKLHELVALCVSALRPTRRVWSNFVSYLRKLKDSGELTSDEEVAVLASGLTDSLLVDEVVEDDPDSSTLAEVVERVKVTLASEVAGQLESMQAQANRTDLQLKQLTSRIDQKIESTANGVTWVLAIGMSIVFIVGTILGIISGVLGKTPSALAFVLFLLPLAIAGLLGLLWGFNLKGWMPTSKAFFSKRIHTWMRGEV
jgi:hypothetical protein